MQCHARRESLLPGQSLGSPYEDVMVMKRLREEWMMHLFIFFCTCVNEYETDRKKKSTNG